MSLDNPLHFPLFCSLGLIVNPRSSLKLIPTFFFFPQPFFCFFFFCFLFSSVRRPFLVFRSFVATDRPTRRRSRRRRSAPVLLFCPSARAALLILNASQGFKQTRKKQLTIRANIRKRNTAVGARGAGKRGRLH